MYAYIYSDYVSDHNLNNRQNTYYIRFLFKDSQVLYYKKFVKNFTDLLVS